MSVPQADAGTASSIRRALALLECASSDNRHKGPSNGSTPLHWPLAVRAARAHLVHALAQMPGAAGAPPVLSRIMELQAIASRTVEQDEELERLETEWHNRSTVARECSPRGAP